MSITGASNYYEDFNVGDRYIHCRGRTVCEMDNVMFTNLSMNTAEGHYNEDIMKNLKIGSFGGQRVVVGTYTISLIFGLASQDIAENALAEVGLNKLRLKNPVYHGDTLYAESEVLEKQVSEQYPEGGMVLFKVIGKNQKGKVVFEGERKLVIKKRSSWLKRDQAFGAYGQKLDDMES